MDQSPHTVTRLDSAYVQLRARTPVLHFLIAESVEANRLLLKTILQRAGTSPRR